MRKFVEQKKLENSPTYQKWLKDQESIEIEQAKEEAAQAAERFLYSKFSTNRVSWAYTIVGSVNGKKPRWKLKNTGESFKKSWL